MTALAGWALLFAALTALRLALAARYAGARRAASREHGTAPHVTIVQPILSGDPALETCLRDNLEANPDAHFLWLVDEVDVEGLAITRTLVTRYPWVEIEIVAVPPPRDGENPKMAKLIEAERHVATDVLLVLDDDTVLGAGGAAALARSAATGAIATGLPVYVSDATPAERLVAGMINGQAFATYFAMAALGANRTINGMVFAVSTTELAAAGGLRAAGHELTDDYAVAKLWLRSGHPIDQTATIARVMISFATLEAAALVVRRWLIFANRYLRRNAGPPTLALVVVPSLLPLAGLAPALAAGLTGVLVWLALLAGKAVGNGLLVSRFSGLELTAARVVSEMAADVMLPLLYLTALVRPRHLSWRTRRMELDGETIRYR